MGMSLEQYWLIEPVKYDKYCEAFRLKTENRLKEQDMLNHTLGKYIAYAFNSPKKYPAKPYFENIGGDKNIKKAEMSDEAMAVKLKSIASKFDKTIK